MQVTLNARVPDPSRMRLEADAPGGHRIAFDVGGPDGDDSAATPTDTLLGALAACTAMDVASILRKKRQRADRYTLHLVAEKADEHPRVFTRIVVEHRVAGDVTHEALRRSVELSATRYCPVNAMLSGRVEVEHRYRLEVDGAAAESTLVVVTGPEHAVPVA